LINVIDVGFISRRKISFYPICHKLKWRRRRRWRRLGGLISVTSI